VSGLVRFPVGDPVVHKSNRDIKWIVTARNQNREYTCTCVWPTANALVHSVIFHEDELDRYIGS
jgi:hypothetical protein